MKKTKQKLIVRLVKIFIIIESVDSMSRDGPDTPIICNTLQKTK